MTDLPFSVPLNRLRLKYNMGVVPEKYPNKQRGIYVSDVAWAKLEQIAIEHGWTWGEKGNVSKLIEAIGQELLTIGLNDNLFTDEPASP